MNSGTAKALWSIKMAEFTKVFGSKTNVKALVMKSTQTKTSTLAHSDKEKQMVRECILGNQEKSTMVSGSVV